MKHNHDSFLFGSHLVQFVVLSVIGSKVLPVYSSVMFVIFQYALENEELTQHLGAAKDAQRALTAEVTRALKRTSIFTCCNSTKMPPYDS